jgi:hypothetical protein
MRSVLFNFNFELMLLFTEYFKIVLERFRSSLLHYRYTRAVTVPKFYGLGRFRFFEIGFGYYGSGQNIYF